MNNSLFEKNINYTFKEKDYLDRALTHSSFIQDKSERRERDNERLEFLGDAVFDAIISESLFFRLPDVSEGRLTKLRANIVCEKSLAEQARRLGLGEYLKLGKGEERMGGRDRDSILADAMEAVIGAIFIDSGFESARKFVLWVFEETIEAALQGKLTKDYKTELQEKLQVNGDIKIVYITDKEEGPDHDKIFYVSLFADNKKLGSGVGKSKKEAEQHAAKHALEKDGEN